MPVSMKREIKATNCISTRDVIRETVGDARWQSFVANLAPAQKELATRRLLAVEWLDFDAWLELEQRAKRDLFDDSYENYRQMTRLVGERDFSGIYKVFLKIGSPGYIVQQVAKVWATFCRVGKMSCPRRPEKPTRAEPTVLLLEGLPANADAMVAGAHGTIDAVLKLTRAHEPDVWLADLRTEAGMTRAEYHLIY